MSYTCPSKREENKKSSEFDSGDSKLVASD